MGIFATAWKHVRNLTHKPLDHPLGFAVAVSGALMQMMCYGVENTISTFFADMQKDATLNYPQATTLSFSSSLSLGLSSVFGILAGFLTDRLPPRLILGISTLMMFLALWVSSAAHSGVGFVFSYGIFAAMSSAFMISPGAIATSSWFKRRIGLAQGINFCGGGIGSATIPPTLGSWLAKYGWRKTFRRASWFCLIGVVATILSCRRSRSGDSDSDEDEEHQQHDARVTEGEHGAALDREGDAAHHDGEEAARATHDAHAHATKNNNNIDDEGSENNLRFVEVDTYGMHSTDIGQDGEPFATSSQLNDMATTTKAAGKADKLSVVDATTVGAATQPMVFASAHDELMHALHTRRLTLCETLRVFLTVEFLSNFIMLVLYSLAFYGFIYLIVPLVSSMGKEDTVYENVETIAVDKAATVFVFWGAFQVVGSVFIGALATFTANAFAYTLCSGVGGVAGALLAFCRTYLAFAACTSIVGICTAGMFAVMPALIARDLYGPNLGLYMSCIFAATIVGGFSAPPIQAQLQSSNNGNYTYGCIFNSIFMMLPGYICYMFVWRKKQGPPARLWRHMFHKRHTTNA